MPFQGFLCEYRNGQTDLPKPANGDASKGEPIPLTYQEPNTEKEKETPISPTDINITHIKAAFNYYNRRAGENGWSKADTLTTSRHIKIRVRVKDVGGVSGWCDVIDRIPKSRFLMGKIESRDGYRFKMHLDFLLQESSFTKLREGFYDDPDAATPKFRPL